MGILQFIKKISVQPAIYWGNPQPDGYGGYTYAEPRQIYVRWDEGLSAPSFIGADKLTITATVMVNEDLELGGFLCLGELPDYPEVISENPLEVAGAFSIQKISRIPLLKSKTKFVRIAYL